MGFFNPLNIFEDFVCIEMKIVKHCGCSKVCYSELSKFPVFRVVGQFPQISARCSTTRDFFSPSARFDLRASCRLFEHSGRQESLVKLQTPELNGLGRNDGLQTGSCNSQKSGQL